MIKFTGSNEKGETVLGLGLSRGNWKKLLEGKPIHIQLAELGIDWKGEILILGGDTEHTIIHELGRIGVLRGVPVKTFDEEKEQQ